MTRIAAWIYPPTHDIVTLRWAGLVLAASLVVASAALWALSKIGA